MSIKSNRIVFAAVATLLTAACGQSGTVPASGGPAGATVGAQRAEAVQPADTTSILKKLTKNVTIGSTIDPGNGDMGPRALSLSPISFGKIKKGDLLVCNFEDSTGAAGKGTTVELLPSKASSKPTTFVQNSKIQGCDGVALVEGNVVYVTGLTSKDMIEFTQTGKLKKTYTSPIGDPLIDSFGAQPPGSQGLYAPFFVFVGDVGTGSVDALSLGPYGTGNLLQSVTGFATTTGTGWSALGPSGLAYNSKIGTLFVVDGVNNTVIQIDNTPNLLVKDEIVVKPGGKTFKCSHPKDTCAKLVLAGSPLDAPEAATLLPNGNIVVANTAGGNTLVEMTPSGQVLDTKVVDTGNTGAITGLLAAGKSDTNTVLYYTDTNSNTVQELTQ